VTSMIWGAEQNVIVTADTARRFIVCILKRVDASGWTVAGKLMDQRADSAILHLLLNPTNDLLLVSTEESNSVWNIKTKDCLYTRVWQPTASFQWINHPTSARHHILITTTAVTIIDWESSERAVSTSLMPISENDIFNLTQGVKNAMCFANNQLLAVELAELYGDHSTTQTLIFTFDNTDSNISFLVPTKGYQTIGKEIKHLIGAYRSKLLFLDKTRWVCSVDVETTDFKSYVRHFPIPSEWESQQRRLQLDVTNAGDVLFVRTDEVAVISRGLDFEKRVALEDN